MSLFQSPLASRLNSEFSDDQRQGVSRNTAQVGASVTGEGRRAGPSKPSYAATPSLLLRSKLSPGTQLRKQPQTTTKAAQAALPVPTTTLDEQLSSLSLGGTAQPAQATAAASATTQATPRRQLPQHLLSTPGHPAAPGASSKQLVSGTLLESRSSSAVQQQWTPLVASPSLGAGKAQGAGLLSVKKGGGPSVSPAPTALQLTPQPAAAPSSSTAGGLSSRLAAQQQQQQQLWGQQGGLATPVMHDAAGVPEQPGSSALLLHSLAASVPQSRAGLSVKLEGAEDPAALRRELRSMVPDLPVGQYCPPAVPGITAAGQQAAGPAGVTGKPAFVGGGAEAAAALERLRGLRREGDQLAEEGCGMDRCRAFVSQARPLLEEAAGAATAPPCTPGSGPASVATAVRPQEAASSQAVVAVAAASGQGHSHQVEGGRDLSKSVLDRLAALKGLQQQGSLLVSGQGD